MKDKLDTVAECRTLLFAVINKSREELKSYCDFCCHDWSAPDCTTNKCGGCPLDVLKHHLDLLDPRGISSERPGIDAAQAENEDE